MQSRSGVYWHDLHTKFHKNPSVGLKVKRVFIHTDTSTWWDHNHHHQQWHCSPESGLGLPSGFRDDITMCVISPTIDLILVTLIRHQRHLVAKQVNHGWEMAAEFCLRASVMLCHARRVLLHAVNLRHGTDGFTPPPKEGVLRILSPLKSIVLGRVWTRDLGSSGKPTNH
jgi:hypothetical protein